MAVLPPCAALFPCGYLLLEQRGGGVSREKRVGGKTGELNEWRSLRLYQTVLCNVKRFRVVAYVTPCFKYAHGFYVLLVYKRCLFH